MQVYKEFIHISTRTYVCYVMISSYNVYFTIPYQYIKSSISVHVFVCFVCRRIQITKIIVIIIIAIKRINNMAYMTVCICKGVSRSIQLNRNAYDDQRLSNCLFVSESLDQHEDR